MKKKTEKKIEGEVKAKKLMFSDIVYDSAEDAAAHGFIPDPALTPEDLIGCEAVLED